MTISWAHKSFDELKNTELYEILALRQEVFIIEQRCFYLDADGIDINAVHLIGYDDDADKKIIAYARIMFPDADNLQNYVKFGRVLVDKSYRAMKLGKLLIQQILDYLQNSTYTEYPIKISAQTYLIDFYKSFGFKPQDEIYLDAEIPHIDMIAQQ